MVVDYDQFPLPVYPSIHYPITEAILSSRSFVALPTAILVPVQFPLSLLSSTSCEFSSR